MDVFYSRIYSTFKNDNVRPRRSGGLGIWLSFLLPVAIMMGWLKNSNVTETYKACSIFSFNLLLNVLFLLYHINQNKSLNVTKRINVIYGFPMSVSLYMYYHYLKMDFRRSFCYAVSNGLLYFEGVPFLLKVFPETFTFGEVNVAVQGFSLFIFCLFLFLNKILSHGVPESEQELSIIILLLMLSCILVLCIFPYAFKTLRLSQVFYVWALAIGGVTYFSINYILGLNSFHWIWMFFMKPERVGIMIFWLICSSSAILTVQHHIRRSAKSSTITRKYFHLFIALVFSSGIFYDINLLYFSSGCVFALFTVLEVLRILNLPPLNKFLRAGFSIYCDEKDSGNVALTPICLLVGHAFPLWLHPHATVSSDGPYLPLLSGVLSVGVGDSFASFVGKIWGRHKLKGSSKTYEGTFGSIASQIVFVMVLEWTSHLELSNFEFLKCVLVIFFTSIVEARTDQIDNIALPLIMYIFLML